MKALAVFGALGVSGRAAIAEVTIDDMVVRHAILHLEPPSFAARAAAGLVLLRVDAFSCNYRDKGFLDRIRRAPASNYFVIGSEFCGTVLQVGADVVTVRAGDRVIGQNAYHGVAPGRPSGVQGLATNSGSKEYLVLPAEMVTRIPAAMSVESAASFSVGAQTSYSMVRRAGVGPGAYVLVTSATSNTSLFLIRALALLGARITATTSAAGAVARLRDLGVERVILAGGAHPAFHESEGVLAAAREVGGFDAVFDAFFDLHLARAVMLLRPFGTYVTCGLSAQTPGSQQRAAAVRADLRRVMTMVMVNNLSLVGNCLGTREDLERAVADHAAGKLDVPVDSVYDESEASAFLVRTYNAGDRFGKVVCRYRH